MKGFDPPMIPPTSHTHLSLHGRRIDFIDNLDSNLNSRSQVNKVVLNRLCVQKSLSYQSIQQEVSSFFNFAKCSLSNRISNDIISENISTFAIPVA